MRVSGGDALGAESVEHGGWVDAEVFGYAGERPASLVAADGVVDLCGGQDAIPRLDAVAPEDRVDRPSVDSELLAERSCGRAQLVALDEVADLAFIQAACSPGSWSPGRLFGVVDGAGLLHGDLGPVDEVGGVLMH